jgi:hypothetical protein
VDEPKRRGESAHETYNRILVRLRPRSPRRNDLELERRHRIRRHPQPAIPPANGDEVLRLTEWHRVAFSSLEAFETHRRAHQFLDGIIALPEPLER